MSSFTTLRLNEDELTSPSSDEKMDTGSESFRSQDTPSSVLSDFEDRDPEHGVLRLQNPDQPATDKLNFNDSLITKMSNLKIDSPKTEGRPRNLGISPPRFSSTLTLTTNHPLMGLGSPDENFPDVIPKKLHKIEDEKDLSLSSIEDERHNSTGFYSPQRNTSKNNLYFTENFVTAESHILNDSLDAIPPDVARVDKVERRKIAAKFNESKALTPLNVGGRNDSAIGNCLDARITSQSTPKCHSQPVDVTREEYHTGVAEWCESPSHLRSMPNFQLPIEMSTSIQINNDLESPDAISASTPEERSAYQALLDPYTGNVALRHTASRSPNTQRRKIQLPPDDDRCSLDSVSACSMESEEEPPEPPQPPGLRAEPPQESPRPPRHHEPTLSDDEDTKRSISTNTMSSCSEPIPEYSAAEELSNERAWVSVSRGNTRATCDMKVIEPYKRVLSHGGYDARGAALIVFSACHLPDNKRPDYTYVMDNLFLYVIWTLERLVTDEYVLVYLHGSAGRRRLPTFHWLHECYKLIDRRLRKSLKHLYLVHPTFWLKSFVILTKPFVSSKFFRKLSYVRSLAELAALVPVEPNAIPDQVKQYDATRTH
ncbi:protein prune homolog 2-like isoform X1 [Manduca sexta]|uniref:protein prune homolog 2-like isoform X1 n=1 Tax=Manduca sexta TaxID=7130 RepID=UPI001890112F|nr:protein prune homolog 2-like isoform X1 [Manduca sexta]